MTKKRASRNVDKFIASIGEISLDKVYDIFDRKNTTIRQLNLPNLVKQMAKSILALNGKDYSGNNVSYSASDKVRIDAFLTNFNRTTEHFMDFLDYNHDSQVQLVEFEENTGKLDVGKDLQEFINDVKEIGSSFKTNNSPHDKVFSVLSQIFMFMLSDKYVETKEDVVNFNESVKASYKSLKALKHIDHNNVFDSRVDDMVNFIITFCVILIPVIELVNKKLAELNKNNAVSNSNSSGNLESDNLLDNVGLDQVVITNADIFRMINVVYGNKLDYVLDMVDQLTKKMVKFVGTGFLKGCKQKLCCCCISEK
jgi:hypothetical protein